MADGEFHEGEWFRKGERREWRGEKLDEREGFRLFTF